MMMMMMMTMMTMAMILNGLLLYANSLVWIELDLDWIGFNVVRWRFQYEEESI